jgi:hypothetical protein
MTSLRTPNAFLVVMNDLRRPNLGAAVLPFKNSRLIVHQIRGAPARLPP